jgi:chromosome segregation ATPase
MSRFNALWDFDGDSIDVSDINPEELKFDLIKDPVRRAGFVMDLAVQKIDGKKRDARIQIDTLNKFKNDYASKVESIESNKKAMPGYEDDIREAEKAVTEHENELKDFKAKTSKKEPNFVYQVETYERRIKYAKEKVQDEKKYLKDAQKEITFAEKDMKWIAEKLNNMGITLNGIDDRILDENKKIEKLHKEETDMKGNKDKFIAQAKADIEAAKKTAPSVSTVINNHVKLLLGNLKLSAEVLNEMAKAMKLVFIKYWNSAARKYKYKRIR